MKKNGLVSLLCLISATTGFAETFNCADYYHHTTLSVNYAPVSTENRLVKGTFEIKSDTLPGEIFSGTFFNYAGEPDNYGLNNLDCTHLAEDGYCAIQSGKWLSAGAGRYNLTFGNLTAVVTCHGDVP